MVKDIKVLQLGKFYPPDIGGVETTIYNITEGLNKSGIKCDVLCANSKNEYKEEAINGYKIYRVRSFRKIFSTAIAPQMISKLKEIVEEYDIIHIHHPDPMANLALFLVNPQRQKIVVHYHSDIIKQRILQQIYKPLLYWMLKKADVIIATSPPYAEGSQILRKFSNKVRIVPIGVERPRYNEIEVKSIKEKFKNKKIVFSLGRMVYYKGFEYLIESAKYLGNDYVIIIGGDGPFREKLSQKAKKFPGKVYLLGKLDNNEVGNFFKACDVFCLPSIERSEAFGVVLLEAMSLGKPVVATNIPYSGVSWVNQHGVTGFNIEPKNSKDIADALRKICEDKPLYEEMSKNALLRYENNFTVKTMIIKLVEIYKELLKWKS